MSNNDLIDAINNLFNNMCLILMEYMRIVEIEKVKSGTSVLKGLGSL